MNNCTSVCALPGCRRIAAPRHLMCSLHWEQVAKELQTKVYDSFRAYERANEAGMRAPGRHVTREQHQAIATTRAAYMEARRLAIAAVIDKIPPAVELKTRDEPR
jgi:hypothetical protein